MLKTKIKISLLVTLIVTMFVPFSTTFAVEAPPSLDLGSLLEGPPSFNVDGIPEDDSGNDNNNNDAGNNNDNNDNNNNNDDNNDDLRITNDSVDPRTFNPLTTDATIKYRISGPAKVDVEIFDSRGQKVAVLSNNQQLAAGEYSVKWKGTQNNQQNGTIVSTGEYTYKITAKDPNSGIAQATKQGSITVSYANVASENRPQPQPVRPQDPAGTLVLQNMQSGRTSDTGPAILLYSLFPVAGYLYSRRKK